MGCHFLLQGIFPTQGLNPCLLHWQAEFLPLSHQGSPFNTLDQNKSQMDRAEFYLLTRVVCPIQGGKERQENWSGLPFPPPGDLPNPGIEPMSPVSPALAGEFFTPEPPGKPFLLSFLFPLFLPFPFPSFLFFLSFSFLPYFSVFLPLF